MKRSKYADQYGRLFYKDVKKKIEQCAEEARRIQRQKAEWREERAKTEAEGAKIQKLLGDPKVVGWMVDSVYFNEDNTIRRVVFCFPYRILPTDRPGLFSDTLTVYNPDLNEIGRLGVEGQRLMEAITDHLEKIKELEPQLTVDDPDAETSS